MTAPPMVPMLPAAAAPQMGMPTTVPQIGMPVGMPTAVPIMNMPIVPQQPSQPSDAIQKAMEATLASIALPPPNMGAGDAINVMYVALLFCMTLLVRLHIHLSLHFMCGRFSLCTTCPYHFNLLSCTFLRFALPPPNMLISGLSHSCSASLLLFPLILVPLLCGLDV